MTGKLIKYEMKSSVRMIGFIWIALIAAAVLLGIVGRVYDSAFAARLDAMADLINVMAVFVYVAVFVAMAVVTVLIVIMRFYKGLLADEGYMMHTLPVKAWQLVLAKGTVAAGIVAVSGIAAMVSIFLLVVISDFGMLPVFFRDLGMLIKSEPKSVVVAVEVAVVLILSILKSVYQIYASLCIGQLLDKYRILAAVGAYAGISAVLTVITSLLIITGDATEIDIWISDITYDWSWFACTQGAMAVIFVLTAVQLIVFHIVSEKLLDKKLNLQ